MKLTLASKTVEDRPILDVLDLAAALRLAGIEIYGVPRHLPPNVAPKLVHAVAEKARQLGLAITILDTYLGQFSQNGDAHAAEQLRLFERYLDMAEVLDCQWIRLWPGEPLDPSEARDDHFLRAAHYLAVACDRAAARRLGVVLECHPGINATAESMLRLVHLVGRANVRVTFDPCNQLSSHDPEYGAAGFRRLLPHLIDVHVKNGDPRYPGEDFHDRLLDEGVIDWVEIFRAVRQSKYDGWIAVEGHKRPTPEMDSFAIARHETAQVRKAWTLAAV
ncbi:MAG: sugar phosphate isomerase/epimerase family protein [Pirellulales bacterium]